MFGNHIGIATMAGIRVHVEGNQHVGCGQPLDLRPDVRRDVLQPVNQDGLGGAKVPIQTIGGTGQGEVFKPVSFVVVSRRVRKGHETAVRLPGRVVDGDAHVAFRQAEGVGCGSSNRERIIPVGFASRRTIVSCLDLPSGGPDPPRWIADISETNHPETRGFGSPVPDLFPHRPGIRDRLVGATPDFRVPSHHPCLPTRVFRSAQTPFLTPIARCPLPFRPFWKMSSASEACVRDRRKSSKPY